MPEHIFEYGDAVTEHEWTTAYHSSVEDSSPFFQHQGWCPSCQAKAPVVHADQKVREDSGDSACSRYSSVTASQCNCGWWDMQYSESTGSSSTEGWTEWINWTHGILKRFDVSRMDVLVDLLRRVLVNRPGTLDHLHSRKMEELVRSLFVDVYPGCEVHHCGRSHDGGIDLILVLTDSPVAIQVKRRLRTDKGESVSAVKEFLGVMMVQGFTHGIYVTTAHHFWATAKSETSEAVRRKVVSGLELIERESFLSMLNMVRPAVVPTWKDHIPAEFQPDLSDPGLRDCCGPKKHS
jgi:hypothetical protein